MFINHIIQSWYQAPCFFVFNECSTHSSGLFQWEKKFEHSNHRLCNVNVSVIFPLYDWISRSYSIFVIKNKYKKNWITKTEFPTENVENNIETVLKQMILVCMFHTNFCASYFLNFVYALHHFISDINIILFKHSFWYCHVCAVNQRSESIYSHFNSVFMFQQNQKQHFTHSGNVLYPSSIR